MTIPESDYAPIHRTLIEIDTVYEITQTLGEAIEQKVRFFCENACLWPEFWEGGFICTPGWRR